MESVQGVGETEKAAMEESFEMRVKRLFGSSLFEAVPKSSFPTASWSVADGEVERQEWNRERGGGAADGGPDREDIPCSSAFYDEDGCISKKSKRSRGRRKEFEDDMDDGEEAEGGEGGSGGGEGGSNGEQEESEIRSSIGLDPTLDNEDEEDEHDRAALCREDASERVYMRDIKDHGPYLNCHTAIPDLFEGSFDEHLFDKDPRADHSAASVRLKEDKKVSGCALPTQINEGPSADSQRKTTERDANLKPILKRKEVQIDPKPKKRVRFNPICIDRKDKTVEPQDFHAVPNSIGIATAPEEGSFLPEESHGVPDYLRNPSKYTRYTFDSSENSNAESNKRAFEDFSNLVKSSDPMKQSDNLFELPMTVTFIPRKKASDVTPIGESTQEDHCKESGLISRSCTGATSLESEACEMEEDDAEASLIGTSVRTPKDRRYRSKLTTDD